MGPGREGRQILAVLGMMNTPTVVYSGYVTEPATLHALHRNAVCVDKVETTDRVVEALRGLSCSAD